VEIEKTRIPFAGVKRVSLKLIMKEQMPGAESESTP